MNIFFGLIVIALIALVVVAAPDTEEVEQKDTYESGWLSNDYARQERKYEEDIYTPRKREEEPEPERRTRAGK